MMQENNRSVSEEFKKMTIKAILSIVLFVATYIFLIILACLLTLLCGYAGIQLILVKPAFYTLLIGVGLISMGVLILVFLLKFIVKRNKVDRSELIEITHLQHPKLFSFIHQIVEEVKTDFPKKVYLSSDVNASVFYDSSFWSMFFPIKKNLQIGIGLVNSISEIEFKAILAHEFGHFSQKSMKIGSYVYNVNKIIYNLLFENEYQNSLHKNLGNIHGLIAFFILIAIKIIEGIQWLLKKMYEVVNVAYMGLSREMEFHADEVAANITGSKPLITSLLRADLASHSYNAVLSYYSNTINDSIKTRNIYPQQRFIMNFLANENKLPFENGLPQVTIEHISRYNKSKLVIKDQWSSHPSTEDRVSRLESLNINTKSEDSDTAMMLFSNANDLQDKVTEKLFSVVTYPTQTSYIETDKFIETYTKEYKTNDFNHVFNNYYDDKNPVPFEPENIQLENNNELSLDKLFSDYSVGLIYSSLCLERDINTLIQISNENLKIKSYDYDGRKYSSSDTPLLIAKLQFELKKINESIAINDIDIYKFFLSIAIDKDKEHELKEHYKTLFTVDKDFDDKISIYNTIVNATSFLHETTEFDIIEQNMDRLKTIEKDFKVQILQMMINEVYQPELTKEIKEIFQKYMSQDWVYFIQPDYDNDALNVLFECLQKYRFILQKNYFRVKKELLEFQAQLL